MQIMSEQSLRNQYQRKVNECIENFQYAVEKSFNKIDAQLDELLNQKSNSLNIISSSYDLPKVNSNCLLKLQDDNFQKQICQKVNSLIKNNIQHQVQKKEQQYQNQMQQTQTKLERVIQQKDYQILQLINSQTIQQPSTLISTHSNLKPFTYQLIKENSIKQNEVCHAIAVNKDCSIMVAGCCSQIKVFAFKQGILKQVQLLSEHVGDVYTLNFMKRSDQFISGSRDNQIIIWQRNQNTTWIGYLKLNGHSSSIYCLVLNNNEDLIVSGSEDKTIKFWDKQNEWQCSQTITDHTRYVGGLCFNEQQTKLISCGPDKLILVIEQSYSKQWMVIQKITVEQFGLRLCFIDDYTFTFQPYDNEQMHVFEMNSTNKQYTKTKDIPVKGGSDLCLFPSQYSRNIEISKAIFYFIFSFFILEAQ